MAEEKGYLFEIVANKKNSVDVDKFDYIARDCYNVGLKTSYDFDRSGSRGTPCARPTGAHRRPLNTMLCHGRLRMTVSPWGACSLLNFSRVINNEICYHSKEVYNLYEMFHTRYSLFKRIYTHRVGTRVGTS